MQEKDFFIKEQPSYYANIPANVRYNENLTANAKLLYGEITALSNQKGYCYSGNKYFADLYKVSIKSVSRWVSDLEKEGFIRSELIYAEDSNQVKQRRIFLLNQVGQKCLEVGTKMSIGTDKKVKDNNTINNTVNKKDSMSENKFSDVDEVIRFYKTLDNLPKFIKMTDKRKSHINARITDFGLEKVKEGLTIASNSILLKQALEKGEKWYSVDFIFNPNKFTFLLEGKYDYLNNNGQDTKNGYSKQVDNKWGL